MNNYFPAKSKESNDKTFLWDHEWKKHGNDYADIMLKLRPDEFTGSIEQRNAALQVNYFSDIIKLYKSFNLQKLPKSYFSKEEFAAHVGVATNEMYPTCYKGTGVR